MEFTGVPVWKGWPRRAEDFFHSSDSRAGKTRWRAHKSSFYMMVEKNAHNMITQFKHILYYIVTLSYPDKK